jgi:regulator of RNase E activity RraA
MARRDGIRHGLHEGPPATGDFGFPNKVRVNPGDIDGVMIIPKEIEDEVIEAALEKVRGENMVRKLIQEGMPTRQVWDEHGIM